MTRTPTTSIRARCFSLALGTVALHAGPALSRIEAAPGYATMASGPPLWATQKQYELLVPSHGSTMDALQEAVRQIQGQGENFRFLLGLIECNQGEWTPALKGRYSLLAFVTTVTRGTCRIAWGFGPEPDYHFALFPDPSSAPATKTSAEVAGTALEARRRTVAADKPSSRVTRGEPIKRRATGNAHPEVSHSPPSRSDTCVCEEIYDPLGFFDVRTGRCEQLDGSLLDAREACGAGMHARGEAFPSAPTARPEP